MPVLPNQRHEQFCQQLARGKPVAEAFVKAGFTPNRGNASRLKANESIRQRCAEIKEAQTTRTETSKVNGKDAETGQWIPGNRNGGRPKGARNRLGQQFVEDLHRRWQLSGAAALEHMAQNDQSGFVKVVANVLPRELDASLDITVGLFAECRTFGEAFKIAEGVIGADVPLIEGEISEAEGVEG